LFPDIARDGYDDRAHYPLKYFRETYLREAIDLKDRQSAYSFRHSWRDATRRIEAPQDFLTAIGAWSGGKTTAARYGCPHQPDLYARDVARISYEGLDLSHLYPKSLCVRVVARGGEGETVP
jgi:hypothetical protein